MQRISETEKGAQKTYALVYQIYPISACKCASCDVGISKFCRNVRHLLSLAENPNTSGTLLFPVILLPLSYPSVRSFESLYYLRHPEPSWAR